MSDSGGRPQQTGQSGTPGRYQRSFGGLIGAMLVLIVGVVAFVLVRELVREPTVFEPEPVDYLQVVRELQDADGAVAYPSELPEGWIAKDVQYTPGERPVWRLAMDTDSGAFVGLREEDQSADRLVEENLRGTATEEGTVDLDGGLEGPWRTWTSDSGDRGYATEVGETTVLVYGSADASAQEELIARLTTEPVD